MSDIDREVALEVMGWAKPRAALALEAYRDAKGSPVISWRPSTDIADAWLVVERMRELGFQFNFYDASPPACPHASFTIVGQQTAGADRFADTAPEAICKAALAVVRALKNSTTLPS